MHEKIQKVTSKWSKDTCQIFYPFHSVLNSRLPWMLIFLFSSLVFSFNLYILNLNLISRLIGLHSPLNHYFKKENPVYFLNIHFSSNCHVPIWTSDLREKWWFIALFQILTFRHRSAALPFAIWMFSFFFLSYGRSFFLRLFHFTTISSIFILKSIF